jgi:hypothetical protein
MGFDEQNLRRAADLLELPQDLDFQALAETLRLIAQGQESPLTAAARAGSATLEALDGAARVDAEILALWLSDLMLAQKLGWDAPIALLATAIAQPSLRSAGRRSRPDDPDRRARSAKLLAVLPKLRAKGAGRVIKMLLDDDAVAPATAAKAAGLSDRASWRLFDRLVELGVVRELAGRPSFRLYGL